VTATFDDVGDLVTQHSVQMADIRVGRVTSIDLTDDFRARVTMSLDGSVKIPKDSTPVVSKTSLLGEKYIELRPTGEAHEGPFLQDGDDLGEGIEAPELEFVAEQAIGLLGAVVSDDIAAMIETGAVGFGGRGQELRSIIDDLTTISATLAARSGEIAGIIDGLDRAAATLADNDAQVDALLTNLSDTTGVLVENRDRAVAALEQLTRLASVQNDVLNRFRADIDRQIGQADVILAEVAAASGELENVLIWLDQFITNLPLGIPGDFTQVYMWGISAESDDRSPGGGP
jgi:phospholipid/cholesterol/gamma-HCH transport system substrate-binding protein